MNDDKPIIDFTLEGWQVAAVVAVLFLLGMLCGASVAAQEPPPEPAPLLHYRVIRSDFEVRDGGLLEAQCNDILRAREVTDVEREQLARSGGELDVDFCVEMILEEALRGSTALVLRELGIERTGRAVTEPAPVEGVEGLARQ